jgi:transcription antitermination factor NusG
MNPSSSIESVQQALAAAPRNWYALWTQSHCEQPVHDQLAAKGFHLFLPKIEVWSRRNGVRHRILIPMFPGYLFLRHAMDHNSYVEVLKARGLVKILGDRWDCLATVPDAEVEAIQKVVNAELPALHYPYLREGQRVRITQGPLADVEGILVQTKPTKGLLVLSIELFQRSVAVEIDCTLVIPVDPPGPIMRKGSQAS